MVDLILVLFVFLVKCFNDDSFSIVMYIDYVLCFWCECCGLLYGFIFIIMGLCFIKN